MIEATIADCAIITFVSFAETMGSTKYPVRKKATPIPIEMSQCLPFNTGALLVEDSSKLSSNMDYRLLKNYARRTKPIDSDGTFARSCYLDPRPHSPLGQALVKIHHNRAGNKDR